MYTVCYPGLVAFILTFAVSIYVTKVVVNTNYVQPLVQLRKADGNRYSAVNEFATEEDKTESIKEISIDNLVLELKRVETSNSLDWLGPSTSKAIPTFIDITPANTVNPLKQNMRSTTNYYSKRTSISRNVPKTTREEHNSADENQATLDSLQAVAVNRHMLKKTLKMNLLTLTLLFILVPTQITIIVYESCDDALGECDFFFKMMTVTPIIQLCSAVIHPLVVLYLLEP